MMINLKLIKNKKVMEDMGKAMSNPGVFARVLKSILRTYKIIDREKEHFWCIGLTTKNSIKYIDLVSMGTLNSSLVHPREAFRLAIFKGVCSLIIGHNHPSGDCTPSDEDVKITKRLIQAGKIIGIEVLDHVIITSAGYYSFKEKAYGYLWFNL
jgi:DNA repair protein RadC